MIVTPQGALPSWPMDYICYAVELHRLYDDHVIAKVEAEIRLREKFPDYDVPDARTWRRWAHEKYADLPERRHKFLTPQEAPAVPQLPWLAPKRIALVQSGPSLLFAQLVDYMVFCMMVALVGRLWHEVISSL